MSWIATLGKRAKEGRKQIDMQGGGSSPNGEGSNYAAVDDPPTVIRTRDWLAQKRNKYATSSGTISTTSSGESSTPDMVLNPNPRNSAELSNNVIVDAVLNGESVSPDQAEEAGPMQRKNTDQSAALPQRYVYKQRISGDESQLTTQQHEQVNEHSTMLTGEFRNYSPRTNEHIAQVQTSSSDKNASLGLNSTTFFSAEASEKTNPATWYADDHQISQQHGESSSNPTANMGWNSWEITNRDNLNSATTPVDNIYQDIVGFSQSFSIPSGSPLTAVPPPPPKRTTPTTPSNTAQSTAEVTGTYDAEPKSGTGNNDSATDAVFDFDNFLVKAETMRREYVKKCRLRSERESGGNNSEDSYPTSSVMSSQILAKETTPRVANVHLPTRDDCVAQTVAQTVPSIEHKPNLTINTDESDLNLRSHADAVLKQDIAKSSTQSDSESYLPVENSLVVGSTVKAKRPSTFEPVGGLTTYSPDYSINGKLTPIPDSISAVTKFPAVLESRTPPLPPLRTTSRLSDQSPLSPSSPSNLEHSEVSVDADLLPAPRLVEDQTAIYAIVQKQKVERPKVPPKVNFNKSSSVVLDGYAVESANSTPRDKETASGGTSPVRSSPTRPVPTLPTSSPVDISTSTAVPTNVSPSAQRQVQNVTGSQSNQQDSTIFSQPAVSLLDSDLHLPPPPVYDDRPKMKPLPPTNKRVPPVAPKPKGSKAVSSVAAADISVSSATAADTSIPFDFRSTSSDVNSNQNQNDESVFPSSSLSQAIDRDSPKSITSISYVSRAAHDNQPRASGGGDRMVSDWSVEEVGDWLDRTQLGHHRQRFRSGDVDGQRLALLDRCKLIELGITDVGDRMLIERQLRKLLSSTLANKVES